MIFNGRVGFVKAIIKDSPVKGSFHLKDVPKPQVKPGYVLIAIKAAGICNSDISIIDNTYVGRKPVPIPLILGHEGAGIIEEIGQGICGFNVGDRVSFEAVLGCASCSSCRVGLKNMCNNWEHLGITCDGTFAEYVVINAELVHKIPPSISFADAAFLEPVGLTVRSLESIQPMVGDTAAIVGPGTIGLLHLQALKAAGVSSIIIIGLQRDRHKFKIAKDLGADFIVNASNEDPVKAVQEITNGLGANIVVESANSNQALRIAIDLASVKGRVSCFGLYPEATINFLNMIRKSVTVFGDVAQLSRHFIRAINWVESGKVSPRPLITHRFTFVQADEAIKAFRDGGLKVLFEN
jgi:threonine dehydrogenase-like Zn-dependent dehydrogenase